MIKQVELTRFKKYKSCRFALNPDGVTLLVGGNNAGKSTLIHAISVWEFCKMILLHEKGRDVFNHGEWGSSEGFGMSAEEFLPIAVPSLNHLWTNLKTQLSPSEKEAWTDDYPGYIMRIKCIWDYKDQIDRMLEIGLSLVNDRLFIRITDSNLESEDHLLSAVYLPTFAGVLPKENKATIAERRAFLGRGMAGSIIRNMIYDLYLEDKRIYDQLLQDKPRLSSSEKNTWMKTSPLQKLQGNMRATFSSQLEIEPFSEDFHTVLRINERRVALKDGKYELGNQLGRQESIILIPDGWNLQTETNLDIYEYSWGMTKLQGLHIPADYTDNIVLKGEDGCITLGMNAPLYWTELQSSPLYVPDVIESLYDANKCAFTLCYDTEDGTESKRHNVQYRNKWQNVWTDTPSFGEIFARAIDTNGNYVAPLRFINIGEGLVISLQKADKSSCQIKVSWAHGHVSTTEGEKKIGDVWEIKKENCNDPRKIRFTFTPSGNSKNQFDISIKAPFKDFSIKNIYGDDIENDCWIPYSDIDKYQYHLVGQDIREYTYGNVRRELRWKGAKLYIFEDGRALKTIPYEGSLLTLFDSREAIRSLLERTAQNMLNAEVNVQFVLSNGQRIAFGIKESPFRPRQISDGRVVITGKNRKPFKFTGVLKLIKLDEPNLEPLEMKYDEESQYYILPEEIRSWGKTILVGRTRGRICPALVDLTKDMNGSYRAENRENAILNIREKLNDSLLGDELWTRIIGWFNRAQQEDIPASSILELYCTAQDYKALLCLAFQLYVKCSDNDEREILKEKLKSFSNDLAFQWYWLQPYLSGIFIQLQNFMSDPMTPAMQDIFIKWAMSHEGEDMMKYLSALNVEEEYMKNLGQCLYDVLTSFTEWIKDLCVSSLIEAYGYVSHGLVEELAETIIKKPKEIRLLELSTDEYIESNQDYLGDEVGTFFNNFNEQGKVGNEMWLYKRVNAVVAHIRKEIDLFSIKDEIQRDKIRRNGLER